MKKLFSARSRYSVWRKLWYFLAQAQKEVGLEGINDEALAQMADHLTVTDEDFGSVAVEEKKRRHDVVSLHGLGLPSWLADGFVNRWPVSDFRILFRTI